MRDKYISFPPLYKRRVKIAVTSPASLAKVSPPEGDEKGKELLPFSADDLEQNLRDQAQARISEGQKKLLEDEREKKIKAHYEKRASKLMRGIWEDCQKRTKHNDRRASSTSYSEAQCNSCAAPLKKDEGRWVVNKAKATSGIAEVGIKLRNADVQAGIEWIPEPEGWFQVLQLVWPDAEGNFPGEEGMNPDFEQVQKPQSG